MIFLVEYSRQERRIVTLDEFDDGDRREAERARLDRELKLNRSGVEHEVVLLEARSKEALRKTHGRYFGDRESFRTIVKSSAE